MGIKNLYSNIKSLWTESNIPSSEAFSRDDHGNSDSTHIFSLPFDGEKNLGEIGEIKRYSLQYGLLRLRSWQSYLESEITRTIIDKYIKWVIGSGLRLQSEPNKMILESEGINVDNISVTTKNIEARFNLFLKSRSSTYSGMTTLNKLSNTAYKNAILGGDVLVILRLVDNKIKVQLIDGEHVRKNPFGNGHNREKLANGNTIINGIEISPKGEHIAYYVSEKALEPSKRVMAKTKNGLIQSFLLYGSEYRLDNHRGMPWISVVLETLKKLERYKEATVGSAEEVAKIVYFIKHGVGSTGENPLNKQMSKVFDADRTSDVPTDINSKELASTIAASTNKETFNMPNDSTLEQLNHKNNIYFKEFYETNINIIAACLNIPPDVAMSMYNNSFSASRAALKDWEHTLIVDRNTFKESFLQHIYDYWFEVNVHQNKISVEGYIGGSDEVRETYKNCRFIGANVPHIDPLKEVNAERAKLGIEGAALPLTTPEMATEALNTGDYDQNVANFAIAKEEAEALGIDVMEEKTPAKDE